MSHKRSRSQLCMCGCGQMIDTPAVGSFADAQRRARFALGAGPGRRTITTSGWHTPEHFYVATRDPYLTAGAAQQWAGQCVVRVDRRTGTTTIASYRTFADQISAGAQIR